MKVYHKNFPETNKNLQEHESELFGKFNDIVVEFNPSQRLVFGKSTSFLPLWISGNATWKLPEVIARKGDGTESRPDLISRYSHARVIKQSRDTVIIQWRYYPDLSKLSPTDIVEEYFLITKDKSVFRTIQPGTDKVDRWTTKSGLITQELQLTSDGIRVSILDPPKELEAAKQFFPDKPINKNPNEAILRFSFDQISGDATINGADGKYYPISGNETIIQTGVIEKAIEMDGYYSGIKSRDLLKNFDLDEFTLEGWIALSAYPFDWAPIIQQSDWGDAGFYLGIDQDGHAGFHVRLDDQWLSVLQSDSIELRKWSHIMATFSAKNQWIQLYVNGKLVNELDFDAERLIRSNSIITIGINQQKMPDIQGRMGRGKYPSMFGLDGLIDEINVYPRVMKPEEIQSKFNQVSGNASGFPQSILKPRDLPKIPSKDRFSADYTTLSLYPTWDNLWRVGNHADLVINFEDNPSRLVFWRGTSYGPFFVTENNKWIGDQSNEDYLEDWAVGEAEGCLEHMSDKQNRHSFVRIIHESEARIVIHWRYGSVDSRYLFSAKNGGWGTWTDEYWIVYPDGIAVRHLPHSIVFGDGWIENMFLNAPGTKPEENAELQAFSVIDPEERRVDYSWEDQPARGSMDAMITMVNTRSENRMFCIYPEDSGIEIFSGRNKRYKFHSWNHWPVSQVETDGRGARSTDRITHSSLMHGAVDGNYLLYGITDESIEGLLPKARFWRNTPDLTSTEGVDTWNYVQEQRAYVIESKSGIVEFEIIPGKKSEISNPSFIIKNWMGKSPKVEINGQVSNSDIAKIGFEQTEFGQNLILFLFLEESDPLKVRIEP